MFPTFGAIVSLDPVSLQCPGELHALAVRTGRQVYLSGVTGVYRPTPASPLPGRRSLSRTGARPPASARLPGLNLVPPLSVAENLSSARTDQVPSGRLANSAVRP